MGEVLRLHAGADAAHGPRDQAKIKQTRKAAATSDRQRTRKALFIGHSRPADTTHRAPDRLCKQEVTGSIPVGSTNRTVVEPWTASEWLFRSDRRSAFGMTCRVGVGVGVGVAFPR
jgi:hypothetical protein